MHDRKISTVIFMFVALALAATPVGSRAPQSAVPAVWDDQALATMELPLANADASPRHVRSDYYYRIPIRKIYKSYPIYAPGNEPAGYLDSLAQLEPEVIFDPSSLKTDEDWIRAGELVFDAPLGYGATFQISQVRSTAWYQQNGIPVSKDGIMPFSRYVIRKKGVVEIGSGSCLMCHARLMPDGTLLKGGQGNFPVDRVIGFNLREQATLYPNIAGFLEAIRLGQHSFFSVPWLNPDPIARVDGMSLDEIASAYAAARPGASTRVNLNLFQPTQIPSLIGVGDLRHLDHTGIVLQRSIADLMRYIALVQGANSFDHFGSFALIEHLPDPERLERYSDEQLYALARFLYSLKPPPNPNKMNAAAEQGRKIFNNEGCVTCHTPPLYTSNKLTPADGFRIPADHRGKYQIIDRSVGTDSTLALQTRKGTGYYKVPSLRGVWYRGPFEHSGSVETLEGWFDPKRSVKGHPFGLQLTPKEREALIAFLKTL